jgi:hypothetical protein
MASLTKRELLLQLLELESDKLGNLGKNENELQISAVNTDNPPEKSITENDNEVPLTKPKKKLSEKQLEALKKGQQTRDDNRKKRLEEMQLKKEQEKKILEEKLVKKAIAIKKKQIKKQALLEELSGDETETKCEEVPLQKTSSVQVPVEKPRPKIIFW